MKWWLKIRYIEYQIILGDAPPELLSNNIRDFTNYDLDLEVEETTPEIEKISSYPEGVIHHLSEKSHAWTFSLVYRNKSFDIIKWKTAFAWKSTSPESEEILMEKALFIGAIAGVFFILIDENIDDNFNKLADVMDVFIEKTQKNAPFIVYGILENKQKVVELKNNPEMLNNLADVKKWVAENGGEFRLENLKEVRMNLMYLINEYSHFMLTKIKAKTNYPKLQLGEVHFLDHEDLAALKEIETALAAQAKAGETVDHLLSDMFFQYMQKPEFKEEKIKPVEIVEDKIEVKEEDISKLPPSKIKVILEEIRRGIRRQCPQCFNKDRSMIREVIDHENLIYDYGTDKIYGFKYICGQCGKQWKTEKDWKIETENS